MSIEKEKKGANVAFFTRNFELYSQDNWAVLRIAYLQSCPKSFVAFLHVPFPRATK